MHATGLLVPPSEDDQRDARQKSLWAATHERIERFLPGFLADIIPSPPPPPLPVPQEAPQATPASPAK